MAEADASREGSRFARAVTRSLPWSIGIGIGVALGGWLTVTSGSGAPGASTLDVRHDLIVVPLLSALAALCLLVIVNLLVEAFRSRRSSGR